jgi:hypothetical protein
MEGVLRDIQNVLVYIDDLLVHTDTHEKHLQVLDQVLTQLHKNYLKINDYLQGPFHTMSWMKSSTTPCLWPRKGTWSPL